MCAGSTSKTIICTKAAGTHSTYQDAGTLLVIIDGRQMQCGASMFATLLYVDHVAILTHHTQRLHLVQLRGQVHRRLLLLVEHARVHGAVEDGAEEVAQSGREWGVDFNLHGQQIVECLVGIALDGNVQRRVARIILSIEVCAGRSWSWSR